MIFRPSKVLYFESISSIPAILYKLFFPDTRLFVHYHEYTTLEEYSKGMQVVRWNHYLENRFYFVFSWISHTNKKRLNLFHLDHPKVNTKKLYCFPNYPSSLWSQKVFERNSFADRGSLTLKLVYVGALSVEDTYIFEILDFVAANSYFELEIFSFQMEKEVMDYVESKKCSNIKFSGSIDYANIPLILKSKDIGLILYKGKTLNYIHNAPNKLFEYLNCGLDVWYPKEMIGCRDFKSELNPQVFEIDFNRIEYSITDYEFSYDNRPVNYGKYSAEDASKELLEMLLDG